MKAKEKAKENKDSNPRDYELIVIKGEEVGVKYPLSGKKLTIGRRRSGDTRQNYILIEDKTSTMSSSQTDIQWDNNLNTHVLYPRKTTNPTKVNNKEVYNFSPLYPGNKIEMGKVILQYEKTHYGDEPPTLDSMISGDGADGSEDIFTGVNKDSSSMSKTSEDYILPDESHKYLFDDDEELKIHDDFTLSPENDKTDIKIDFKEDLKTEKEYELEMVEGDEKGKIFSLNKEEISIGRKSKGKSSLHRDIEFFPSDRTISRNHAKLIREGEDFYLINESKKSITLINGLQVLEKTILRHGDYIKIGENTLLLFREKGYLSSNGNESESTIIPAIITSEEETECQRPMAFVEKGPFFMGCNEDPYASPLHEVYIKDIYIDMFPVTNSEYKNFVDATGYKCEGSWNSDFTGENYPVVNITYNDALAYSCWAKKRLPTEAEWEKAARGKDSRQYPWGSMWDERKLNSKESNIGGPKAVDNFPDGVSPYSVSNMMGNTWEWTCSSYSPYPYRDGIEVRDKD